MKPYIILSLDGGGIRGFNTAYFLRYIERSLKIRLANYVDMVAGTSTGGIIACGMQVKNEVGKAMYSMDDILSIYRKDEYMGGYTLFDSISRCITTAYDLERECIHIFDSDEAKKNPTKNFSLRDASCATAAAPAYFEPHLIAEQGRYFALYDGGVAGLNNPALIAVDRAEESGISKDQIFLLSIGTGQKRNTYSYAKARRWGMAEVAKPVISMMMDGASEMVHQKVESEVKNYFRIQYEIPRHLAPMDLSSKSHMKMLEAFCRDYIAENQEYFDQIVSVLDTLLDER
jgi:patatin-like phospholipase/acyl hydrolase